MKSILWKLLFTHPTNILFAGALWGALFLSIGLYASRGVTDGQGVHGYVPAEIGIIDGLLQLAVFITSIVFVFRRRFLAAACYFVTAYMWSAPTDALRWLKGDRYFFTGGPHGEIGEIYNGLRPEFALGPGSSLAIVSLGDQCHPPQDYECWIVYDPAHTSGIEHDIGSWHSPVSPLLATGMPDIDFVIVDVKQLDRDAYSVLTGAVDWGAFKPVQ
jgi:hypothetical protein